MINITYRINNNIYYYLDDYLLNEYRSIYISSDINNQISQDIFGMLEYLNAQSNNRPIIMYLNSPGGSVMDGNSIINFMKNSKSPIYTINVGNACSMAAILLLCGHKRMMLPNAFTMFHQMSRSFSKDISLRYTDMQVEKNLMDRLDVTMFNLIKEKANFPKEVLDQIYRHDVWLSDNECLKYGVIDEIKQIEEIDIPSSVLKNKK